VKFSHLFHLSRRLQIVIVSCMFAVVVIVAFLWRNYSWTAQPAPQPTPSAPPNGYFQVTDLDWSGMEFATVREAPFDAVQHTEGTIAPADEKTVQIFSPYSGRVTSVDVTTGDYVRAGQPLFAIAASEYAQAQNDFESAYYTLGSAQVQLDIANLNYKRQQALLNKGGASKSVVEQAFQSLVAAQAAYGQAKEALDLVRARLQILGVSDADVAKLQSKRGVVPKIDASGVVSAPISGYVLSRSVGVGQNIGSATNGGSSPLLTISDLSTVYFVANVPETAIASVHVGDPVQVRLEAFPDRTFDATVRYIAQSVDPNLHRVAVRAEVANPDGDLKPGMFGTFTITTGVGRQSLTVPENAVIFEEDTARVWVAGPHKTLALRYIKTGATVDGNVQVLSGLRPGDRIVTSGVVFIDRALRGEE
jgi:membrane fusion protein, heavy metal efflux system